MGVRIDKYVWSVRLYKKRKEAVEQIKKHKIKVNDQEVKPSREIEIGDEIQLKKHTVIFTYRVKDLLEKRVGAKLVNEFIEDITPEEEKEKYERYRLAKNNYRSNGDGKPTKKERRDINQFLKG